MKRRWLWLYLSLLFTLLISVPVYAADAAEYELEELGLTISIPSDYAVFTRTIRADDPKLQAYGLTKDALLSFMEERSIYLNGVSEDGNQEIVVTMTESSLVDFNLYSDTVLTVKMTSSESEYANRGVTVLESELYQHAQAKFMKFNLRDSSDGETVYLLQYSTAYNDQAILITFHSYSGPITPAQESMMKRVVDSASFDTQPQTIEFTPTPAFTYTDSKTGTTFTVPANWVEAPLSEGRKSIDVKFESLEKYGMTMMYGSSDLWSEMTESERNGYSRSDVDHFFTKTDVAAILGLPANDISTTKYAGNEFFIGTITSNMEAYGTNLTATLTYGISFNNGHMYFFQFSGTEDNEFFDDFVSMLSSVNYPSQAGEAAVENRGVWEQMYPRGLGTILRVVLLSAAVYCLPIVLYRYGIRKKPTDEKIAKRIVTIYGFCAFLAVSFIIYTGSGIGIAGIVTFLLREVNYRILIGGKAKDSAPESEVDAFFPDPAADMEPSRSVTAAEQPCAAPSPEQSPKFCTNCGAKLVAGSRFCHKCGVNHEQ